MPLGQLWDEQRASCLQHWSLLQLIALHPLEVTFTLPELQENSEHFASGLQHCSVLHFEEPQELQDTCTSLPGYEKSLQLASFFLRLSSLSSSSWCFLRLSSLSSSSWCFLRLSSLSSSSWCFPPPPCFPLGQV